MDDLSKQINSIKNALGGLVGVLAKTIKEEKKAFTKDEQEKYDRWYKRAEDCVKNGDIVGLNNLKQNF